MKYLKDNPVVLAAVIVAVGAVAAVMIYRYTSPFQQCLRQVGAEAMYACKDFN